MKKRFLWQKAFTLTELLVVLVIVGMLVTVLFRTYVFVSHTYTKADVHKTVATTYTSLITTLQTMIEWFSINTSFYEQKMSQNNNWKSKNEDFFSLPFFFASGGFTNILALRNEKNDLLFIYPHWVCIPFSGDGRSFVHAVGDKQCWLEVASIRWKQIKTWYLTNPSTTYVSNVVFKLLPQIPLSGNVFELYTWNEYFYLRQKQAFWLLGTMRPRYWIPDWQRNVSIKMQMFFGLN